MPMPTILRVAIPSPLRQLFDYLPPATDAAEPASFAPGQRIEVPFGRRRMVGLIIEIAEHSDYPPEQLRPAHALLDREPALPPRLLDLLRWAADYYHHPLGECWQQALPVLLRKGEDTDATQSAWQLTTAGLALPENGLKRAPQQQQALTLLLREASRKAPIADAQLPALGLKRETLRAMAAKGLVERIEIAATALAAVVVPVTATAPQLTDEQQQAVDAVAGGRFQCHLLDGVTGSGKTEVYLRLIEAALARGEQALVLVPEIGLTPQTLTRFQQRLPTPIAVLHSGLTDHERLHAWRRARSGEAGVVLGTRSAVFADCPNLGLIIVDEEHDASFKQQDGFRYHARDIAIKRAADWQIPIVLGSATPALESLHNAISGRYRHLLLSQRAGNATPPRIDVLDIRHQAMADGLAPATLQAISATLAQNNQALVFLNRRGFAPTLLCHDCGWIAQCRHCDARLTVHSQERRLRCHHCGFARPMPHRCDDCGSQQLEFRGPGTERLELALAQQFPDTPVIRIDRDSTARKHALRDKLADVHSGAPCVLVGTQMLAKGHHFPDVTLVVMVDIDGGLVSADFRGPEKLGQLLTQVAGRAGRAEKPGRVLIQTHYPDHPLLASLLRDGYGAFARELLAERRDRGLPPLAQIALLRADSRLLADAEQLLADLRAQTAGIDCIGPLPAPMSRRAGMFRAQLLLRATHRAGLHRALFQLCSAAENHPLARKVRWSIDVDAVDLS
jgi:primosomal protein N' (replication factor Y)